MCRWHRHWASLRGKAFLQPAPLEYLAITMEIKCLPLSHLTGWEGAVEKALPVPSLLTLLQALLFCQPSRAWRCRG